MATPTFNIGGLVSGLDTNSIVSQLMQLERTPLNQVQSRRSSFQARNEAWNQISGRLSGLRDKVRSLDDASDWRAFSKVSTTNEAAVGVAVSGDPAASNLSFTVDRLAASQQVATNSALASGTDLVGTGTFSLTIGGTQHDVTTDASTTLSDLAASINALDAGVTASVVTVDTGDVELFLSADESGDGGAFTVSAGQTALGTFGITQQGQDARLVFGSGAGAITIERSSNTITDVLEGVTLELKQTTTVPVTVSVGRDVEAAVTKIRDMVNDLNSALSFIETRTAAAREGGTAGGVLSSDSSARGLKLGLRSAISGIVSGLTGDYTNAASVGISLSRTGTVTLDETKLREALQADFSGVQSLFALTTTATDSRVSVARVASTDLDGTHAVQITAGATRASVTGSVYSPPVVDATFDITTGGRTATVTIGSGSDILAAVAAINQALIDAGIRSVVATNQSGAIVMGATRYGSSDPFTVTANDFGLAGTHAGADVAGTIGGVAATGNGQSLSGTGTRDGLVLTVTATPDQVSAGGGTLGLGTVIVRSGLATTFEDYLDSILDAGGTIERAKDRWEAQIRVADDRIEQLQERLERREAALRRQYTAMESAMGRLTGLSASLGAALSSLNAAR
jgi:flagellar hook-associated protein 2